ncbi:MAG: class I SAM-dependent methyltransferase [Beijerinckiaceae bacterium]
MNDHDDKAFWNNQTSSLHRGHDSRFYARKAEEHAALLTNEERSAPCIDLGCGAGELLEYLQHHVNVTVGLDYSETMLAEARQRLSGSKIKLVNGDLFEFLPAASEPTWMTTGAINQYLDPQQTQCFLQLFKDSPSARSLFLFDCVDPVRYSIQPFGLSYLPAQASKRSRMRAMLWPAYMLARRAITGMRLSLGLLGRSGGAKLGRRGMGYGYTPAQWRLFLKPLGLECEIVSSRFYEYRFHVIVRK